MSTLAPTRLYLATPNPEVLQYVDAGINDLVFNGFEFQDPAVVDYVYLVRTPVNGASLAFTDPAINLTANAYGRVKVLDRVLVGSATSNPELVVAVDPSNGQCLCGITCNGTRLSYVQVQVDPNP